MKKTILSFFAVLTLVGFNACNKNDQPEPDPMTGIEKLSIPDGFTFETATVKTITVIFSDVINFGTNKSRVNVYNNLPSLGGKLIASSTVSSENGTEIELQIPSNLQQLFVETVAGSKLVQLTSSSFKEGGIIIDFGMEVGILPPLVVDAMKATPNSVHQTGMLYKSIGSTVNLITNGDFSQNLFGAIADWSSPMTADQKWHITSTLGANHAKQYTQAGEKMLRITPSPARYGGVTQLIQANPGELITFTSDMRSTGNSNNIAWLFLIPRNASGNAITFFSIQTNNPSGNWITRTIAATMPAGTVSVQVLLWSHIYGGAIDYDNVIVTGPVSDRDGDGVDDELDDYPDDAQRAFNVFYPNADDFGTLAFEDLWPGKGDYDFNDLVVDYRFKQVLNANNALVEFFLDYQVRAIGASLENGFGFEIPGVNPSNVKSITGQQLTESYVNLNSNGTESGQENAVIILFDNAFSMMETPSGSFGVNTMLNAPYVTPVIRQLVVRFQTPVSTRLTGFAPFNPFLIVDKTRGREVHLPGKTPTNLHDPAYFGQWFDNTLPSIGKYYQSASNLPWAINLPIQFEYPVEKTDITAAYLKFGSWAESGGESERDWYSNEGSGYRNEDLIYKHKDQ